MAPYSYIVADTRMFMYAGDVTMEISKFLITKANDTDVVVTAAFKVPSLQ